MNKWIRLVWKYFPMIVLVGAVILMGWLFIMGTENAVTVDALRAEVDRLRAAERQAADRELVEAREHDRLCLAVQAGAWLERSWRDPVAPDLAGARHEQLQLEADRVQDGEAGRCLRSGDRWELRMREVGREHGWLPPEQGGTP